MKPFAIALVLLVTACHFQRGNVRAVELVEFGTFQKTQSRGYASAPNALGGRMNVVVKAVLLERTAEIHAHRGTSFGVRIKLVGEPDGLVIPCTAMCFPPKYTDPATGQISEKEEWPIFEPIGRADYIGYTFDNDWEIVPGRWTIQVFVGSQLKVEQTFNVIAEPSA